MRKGKRTEVQEVELFGGADEVFGTFGEIEFVGVCSPGIPNVRDEPFCLFGFDVPPNRCCVGSKIIGGIGVVAVGHDHTGCPTICRVRFCVVNNVEFVAAECWLFFDADSRAGYGTAIT